MEQLAQRMRRRGSYQRLFAIAYAIFAAGMAGALLLRGIVVTPDGWTYWEGSVSLLKTYRYELFGGDPITSFPPLYSLYLAAVQALLGVSGRTLIVANILLAAGSSAAWANLIQALRRPTLWGNAAAHGAATAAACYIALNSQSLLSETLSTPLLALLLTTIITRTSSTERRISTALAVWALSFALLLTKNSNIAFVAGAGGAALFLSTGAVRQRLAVVLPMIAAVAAWLAVRSLLNQGGSHTLSAGGRFSPVEYVIQAFEYIALEFGVRTYTFGGIALLLVYLACLLQLRVQFSNKQLASALVFCGVSIGALIAIFNLVWIADPLSGRFMIPIVLTLFAVTASLAGAARGPRKFAFAAILAFTPATLQLYRTARFIEIKAGGLALPNVAPIQTIDSARQDFVIIAPPTFEWQERARRANARKDKGDSKR